MYNLYFIYIYILYNIHFLKGKNSKSLPLPLLDLKSSEHPCMFPLRLSVVYYQEQLGRQINVGTNKQSPAGQSTHLRTTNKESREPCHSAFTTLTQRGISLAELKLVYWLNISIVKNRPL